MTTSSTTAPRADRPLGPNCKLLLCAITAQYMVPAGSELGAVVARLMTPGELGKSARRALDQLWEYIDLVKTSPDNPYPDDEAIAAAILEKISGKERGHG